MTDETKSLMLRLNREIEASMANKAADTIPDRYAYRCGYMTTLLTLVLDRVPEARILVLNHLAGTESFRAATNEITLAINASGYAYNYGT